MKWNAINQHFLANPVTPQHGKSGAANIARPRHESRPGEDRGAGRGLTARRSVLGFRHPHAFLCSDRWRARLIAQTYWVSAPVCPQLPSCVPRALILEAPIVNRVSRRNSPSATIGPRRIG